MMTGILGFFGGIWGKVLGAGSVLLGSLLVLWKIVAGIKNAGRREQRLEDANAGLKARLDARERVDDVEQDVDHLDDVGQRLERLRANERAARAGTGGPER